MDPASLEFMCRHCGREAKTRASNTAHECRCHSNPDPKIQQRIESNRNRQITAPKKRGGFTLKNQYVKAREEGREWKISEETREKIREANRRRRHSKETRAKISASRKAFLQENPHMVPYRLNHYSKGESYAEMYFRGVLESSGVSFKQEHQVGLYSLDFAVLDRMIDLEIDGDQHHLDPRIVESDRKRNEHLQGLGWNVIRVRWSSYQALSEAERKAFCEDLIKKLK